MSTIRIAGGSIAGRAHVRAGRNNQDAYAWRESQDGAVLVVCDGCSAEPHSEVGARLGATMLAEAIARRLSGATDLDALLVDARTEVLAALGKIVDAMAGSAKDARRAVVYEQFLFTVLGAIVTRDTCLVFGLGDGAAWVNGEPLALATFPGNAPPYLGYALVDARAAEKDVFCIHSRTPAAQLQSLTLGSDGAHAFASQAPVGSLLAERTFANRDMVRRALVRVARVAQGPASLEDDVTLLVLQRTRLGAPS